MKTYHSTQRILMGPIRFQSSGSDYVYTAKDKEEERALECSYFFKRGIVTTDDADEPEEDDAVNVVTDVVNCKQAVEWLVANKDVKRGVYSREQVLDLAKENNVEFPNLAKKK